MPKSPKKTKPKTRPKPKPAKSETRASIGNSTADTIEQLAAEVLPGDAPGGKGGDRPAGPPPGVSESEWAEQLRAAEAHRAAWAEEKPKIEEAAAKSMSLIAPCILLVTVLGAIVTARIGVADLTDDERGRIGMALAGVGEQYDLSGLSPKAAAWLSLGVAVAGAAFPRVEQYRKTIDAEAVTEKAGEKSRNEKEPVPETDLAA